MAALVQELAALQRREGWLCDASLAELAERLRVPLHRLESLTSYYPHFHRRPPAPHRIEVCRDLSCALAGSEAALERLRATLGERSDVEIVEISCPGRCDRAPAALLGDRVHGAAEVDDLVAALAGESHDPVDASRDGPAFAAADPYPSATDHYATLAEARQRPPTELVTEIESAGLRGMGGAAFPTGRKWSLVAAESAPRKVVVCNADESEPGTFKDREILRRLPHLVVEGMALAARAVGASEGIVFIRHEYAPERARLEAEIAAARAAGVLGDDALGGGRSFDVEVFVSPGGYILGEETALLECLEDRRGEPRNKPPFPGTSGLEGAPTLINNVETFAHATAIVRKGADWWRSLGVRGRHGHKFISVSGDVVHPGVHLVRFGTTFGELLERCGGMQPDRPLLTFAPGGASSRFLGVDALDLPIDFEAVAEAGSMLGSGAAVFVGEGRDLLEVGLSLTRFFRNESCGKCVPCRLGTEKAVKLVEASGGIPEPMRQQLDALHGTLARTSLCGLGHVALAPLLSLVERFPERMGGR